MTSGSNSEDSQTWNCLSFKSSCQSWEWTGVENSSGPHLARTIFWEKLCWSHKHSENEASFVKPCKGKQIQRSLFHYDVSKLWRGHATPAGPSEGCRRARHPLQPSLVWFWFVFRALVVKHLPRRTWQRQVLAQKCCKLKTAFVGIHTLPPQRKAGSRPLERRVVVKLKTKLDHTSQRQK